MSDILSAKLAVHPQAVDTRVGEETVLLHLEKGVYYGLDEIGTRLWEGLKAGRAAAEICKELAEEYDAPLETIEQDARGYLEDLVENGIILAE